MKGLAKVTPSPGPELTKAPRFAPGDLVMVVDGEAKGRVGKVRERWGQGWGWIPMFVVDLDQASGHGRVFRQDFLIRVEAL